jgi:hypothetical protein
MVEPGAEAHDGKQAVGEQPQDNPFGFQDVRLGSHIRVVAYNPCGSLWGDG